MHRLAQGSACEQVGACGLELAGARSQQREPDAPVGDLAMHLVQQARKPLHLVDDDPLAGLRRRDHPAEQCRVREQVGEQRLVEQIEAHGRRQRRAHPSALADASQTEQEEAAVRQRGHPFV